MSCCWNIKINEGKCIFSFWNKYLRRPVANFAGLLQIRFHDGGRWQRRRQWTVSSSCPTSATITFLCRESSGAVFLLSGNYISHFSKTLFLHRSKPHLQRLLSWTVAFEIYLIKGELLGKDSFRRGLQTFPPGSYFPIGDIGHYSASCWSPTTFYFIPLFWFFYLRILILSVKQNPFLKSPMVENGDFKLKTKWRNKEDRIGQTAEKNYKWNMPGKKDVKEGSHRSVCTRFETEK